MPAKRSRKFGPNASGELALTPGDDRPNRPPRAASEVGTGRARPSLLSARTTIGATANATSTVPANQFLPTINEPSLMRCIENERLNPYSTDEPECREFTRTCQASLGYGPRTPYRTGCNASVRTASYGRIPPNFDVSSRPSAGRDALAPNSAVVQGVTRAGSAPPAAYTSRATSNQLVYPPAAARQLPSPPPPTTPPT